MMGQQDILEYIKKFQSTKIITIKDICDNLHLGQSTVNRSIIQMEKYKIVKITVDGQQKIIQTRVR